MNQKKNKSMLDFSQSHTRSNLSTACFNPFLGIKCGSDAFFGGGGRGVGGLARLALVTHSEVNTVR